MIIFWFLSLKSFNWKDDFVFRRYNFVSVLLVNVGLRLRYRFILINFRFNFRLGFGLMFGCEDWYGLANYSGLEATIILGFL